MAKFNDDDLVLLDDIPDDGNDGSINGATPWKILIADDDEQVRISTRFALGNTRILGRPLTLLFATSGLEARQILEENADTAVLLLDVVMENEMAGFEVVKTIRADERFEALRIILRTGQPGYAPELEVIEKYDINDYHTKQELTHTRLVSALTTAIRSYEQLRTIMSSRAGLEKIINASADLVERRALESFAEGVLTQIALVLGLEPDGIVCVQRGNAFAEAPEKLFVVGAAGRYSPYINQLLDEMPDSHIQQMLETSIERREHIFSQSETVIYLNNDEREGAIYMRAGRLLDNTDRSLLEVFSSNISVGYENVSLFQSLRETAYRDSLTGLPNRLKFVEILEEYNKNPGQGQVVGMLDIDHFADINDALGSDTGNALLQAVAKRLQEYCNEDCVLARIGGDLFGLLGPSDRMSPQALLALFQQAFSAGEHSIPVSVTLGLCRPSGSEDGKSLLRNTNIALNRAKKIRTRHFDYYLPEMEDETRTRVGIVHKLRRSFSDHELEVWYQPQIDLDTGKTTGLEALLRWPAKTPGQPSISPAVFVPLAEYSGLIVDIGYWVLQEASSTLRALREEGMGELRMSVNVSVPQFRCGNFDEQVVEVLRESGLPPELLELEITEGIVIDEPTRAVQTLEKLRKLGVGVAIDDFGTGFSSLSYLLDLPVNRLKIDRSFINKLHEAGGNAIATTIIDLAKRLGLNVIAEGVETREQWQQLCQQGCDEAQGFLFARPMPASILRPWLRQNAAGFKSGD